MAVKNEASPSADSSREFAWFASWVCCTADMVLQVTGLLLSALFSGFLGGVLTSALALAVKPETHGSKVSPLPR